jgi:hypothetical protein
MVLRKRRDDSGIRKKGRSGDKPRVRIPRSTLSGDSVGVKTKAMM